MQRSILQVAFRSRQANLAWSSAGRSGDRRFASAVVAPLSQAMGVLLVSAALLKAWRPQEAATLSVVNGVPLLVPLLVVQVELMLACMLLLRLAGSAERVLLIEAPPCGEPPKEPRSAHYARLVERYQWFVQAPVEVLVRDGEVVSASRALTANSE